MSGYIKLYRSMQEWEWYADPNTKAVFLELLLAANWKDSRYKGVLIKRGQAVIGRKALAEKLGMSEQAVRTALNHLKSTNEITTKSTNKLTVVTIEKYELYQGEDFEPTNKSTNKSTNEQPTNNQQLTTSKKERKERKEIIKEYMSERRLRVC